MREAGGRRLPGERRWGACESPYHRTSLDTVLPLAYLPKTMADLSITLPDGSQKQVPAGTTVGDFVKQQIGAGLARAALFAKLDDEELDLSRPLTRGRKLTVFTSKTREGLALIRHDAAHIMASVVQRLFPGTQVTIGPSTEEGFY